MYDADAPQMPTGPMHMLLDAAVGLFDVSGFSKIADRLEKEEADGGSTVICSPLSLSLSLSLWVGFNAAVAVRDRGCSMVCVFEACISFGPGEVSEGRRQDYHGQGMLLRLLSLRQACG